MKPATRTVDRRADDSSSATRTTSFSLLLSAVPAAALGAAAVPLVTSGPYDLNGLVVGFLVLTVLPAAIAVTMLARRGWGVLSVAPLVLQLLAYSAVRAIDADGWWLLAGLGLAVPLAGVLLDAVRAAQR